MQRLNAYVSVGFIIATCALVVVIITPMKKHDMKAVHYRIARPTNNLPAIIKFYSDGLGLEKVGSFIGHGGYDGVMFGLPGRTYHLEFTQKTDVHEELPEPTKDNLLVFYFAEEEQYREANERLQMVMDIKPVEPENPYWKGKSETYEDPDKWRIVLFNGVFEP